MVWREACFGAVLTLGGLGCGRTELAFVSAQTGVSTETKGLPGGAGGASRTRGSDGVTTTGLDTGPVTTAGPLTTTMTTGFDSGSNDTQIDDTGFPGTTTGPSTTTSSTTNSTTNTTRVTETDGGTTEPGTTDGGTTEPGTTDGGTTEPGTTDGGTTDSGSTDTGGTSTGGGDPTCLDAVDCVIACGGPSPGCINMCDDGLSPADAAAFNALETCIIVQCILNGSCGVGGFGDPACVACRLGGQLDPSTVSCEAQAMNCN